MSSIPSLLDAAPRAPAPPATQDWSALTLDAALAALGSTRLGLSSAEAARRLRQRAVPRKRAALPEPAARFVSTFAAQMFRELSDPVHLVLFLVAVAGATLGAPAVAVAVVALTVVRIALLAGAAWRCDAIAAQLRVARAPRAMARRDGTATPIDASRLVAGDVIELAVGARVPADAKLIEHDALAIDGVVPQGAASGAVIGTGDAASPLVWSGSWVTHGRATAVVVATGADAADAMLSRLQTPVDEVPRLTIESDNPATGASTERRPSLRLDRANTFVLAAAALLLIFGLARGTVWLHSVMAAVTLAALSWSASTRWFAPLQKLAVAAGANRLLAGGVAVRDLEVVARLAALPMNDRDSAGVSSLNPPPTITTASRTDADRARESADVVFDGGPEKLAEAMALAATTARGALGAATRATTLAQALWAALLGAAAALAIVLAPAWPASVLLALHVLALGFGLALCHAQHPTTVSTQPPRWLFVAIAAAIGAAAVIATRLGTRLAADTATLGFVTFGAAALLFALVAATERRNAWRTRVHALWQGREAASMAVVTLLTAGGLAAALHVPLLRDAFETAALRGAGWGTALGLAVAAVLVQFGGVIAWRKWRAPRATAAVSAAVSDSATPLPVAVMQTAPKSPPVSPPSPPPS